MLSFERMFMKRILRRIADYIRECDKLLYILCIVTTLYGCVMVLSSTAVRRESSLLNAFSLSSSVYFGLMSICLALNISPFFSRTSIIWNPSGVSTIWDTIPGFKDIAASEKAVQNMDLEAIPNSPPRRALPGSWE